MRLRGRRLRTEQKYYIHPHNYLSLRLRLANVMQLDEHSVGIDGYQISSLYFDDMRRTAMETKNDGVFKRQKFRIRIYNGSDQYIALERKSKLGEYVAKESVELTKEQYRSILAGRVDRLYESQDALMKDFYCAITTYGYRPVTIVDYWREAYVYPQGSVRITFDKKLSVKANGLDLFHPHLSSSEILLPTMTIMEVKFDDALPNVVRQMLTPSSHIRSSISKYVLCREKMMHMHTQ